MKRASIAGLMGLLTGAACVGAENGCPRPSRISDPARISTDGAPGHTSQRKDGHERLTVAGAGVLNRTKRLDLNEGATMSIVSMVDNKVVQEKRKAVASAATAAEAAAAAAGEPAPTPAPDPGAPAGVPSNVVNQLVVYIPTEVITLWVALIAVLNDPKPPTGKTICHADWSTHWTLAALAAVLSALLTLGFAYRKFADTPGVEFKLPLFGMLAAPAAFLAWAVALPEGPLRSACWYSEEAGAFIVTFATVGIATLAYMLGQGERFKKV